MISINDIKTLKQNSDYRISDVVQHLGINSRWEHSGRTVLNEKKYEGSILQQYLKLNGLYNKPNFHTLLNTVKQYQHDNQLPEPANNEIVIHLRLGDVVYFKTFLKTNYIEAINKILIENKNINKITFVACFAYNEWSSNSFYLQKNKKCNIWKYTEQKQKKNSLELTKIFQSIINSFPRFDVSIYSHENVDVDFCYCVLAKHFIYDNIGGFSTLCYELNKLLKNGFKETQGVC
jgi:hypothetical protein